MAIQYTVVKQKRKTATIVIDKEQQVIVKVPERMTQRQIDTLILQHSTWIEEMLAKKKARLEASDWLITGKQLYLGNYWPVTIKQVPLQGGQILFNTEMGFKLVTDGTVVCARQLMEQFYRRKAQEMIPPLVMHYAEQVGVSYGKITIRKQETRWGSCSSSGNLSFNMKILFAPIEMIEYIVLHEVMHLRHFDHSKAFWADIENYMPDYKTRMSYFKQYGQNFVI